MLQQNKNLRRPAGMNFAVVTLLLLTSGFILSACKSPSLGSKSPEKTQQSHPANTAKQKSDARLKKNQPTQSTQQKTPKRSPGEDTTDDDDPE
ncbi:MAG TPA: hypothetical protein V6D11_06805 [Waterburya sp.]|jgi:hypothetical protein